MKIFMRLLFLFSFIALIGVNVGAQKASQPPRRANLTETSKADFILKEDGFSIDFPAKPSRETSSIDTAFGKAKMVGYKLPSALVFYGVNYIDFPTIISDKTEIALRFDAVKAGLLANKDFRLLSETEISFGDYPGVEYVFDSKETTATMRCLFIKQRFFQITVITKGSLINSTERVKNFNRKTTEKFINSFSANEPPPPALNAVELPKDFGIEIKNKTFSSQFLGFSVNLPKDWFVLEKEREICKYI